MKEATVLKDGRRRQHAPSERVQRHPRLERQDQEAEDEQHHIEDEQRRRVLLPVLRAAVEAFLEPAQQPRRAGIFRP